MPSAQDRWERSSRPHCCISMLIRAWGTMPAHRPRTLTLQVFTAGHRELLHQHAHQGLRDHACAQG